MEQVGIPSPHRNEQFEFIDHTAHKYLENGEPVISVDTKKKENIGNFKNAGAEYREVKNPRKVLHHDFPIPELGKVAPYGVYVLNNNTGFVNLGTSFMTHLNLRPPAFHAGGMPLGKMHSLRQSGYTSRVTVVGVIVPAAAAGNTNCSS